MEYLSHERPSLSSLLELARGYDGYPKGPLFEDLHETLRFVMWLRYMTILSNYHLDDTLWQYIYEKTLRTMATWTPQVPFKIPEATPPPLAPGRRPTIAPCDYILDGFQRSMVCSLKPYLFMDPTTGRVHYPFDTTATIYNPLMLAQRLVRTALAVGDLFHIGHMWEILGFAAQEYPLGLDVSRDVKTLKLSSHQPRRRRVFVRDREPNDFIGAIHMLSPRRGDFDTLFWSLNGGAWYSASRDRAVSIGIDGHYTLSSVLMNYVTHSHQFVYTHPPRWETPTSTFGLLFAIAMNTGVVGTKLMFTRFEEGKCEMTRCRRLARGEVLVEHGDGVKPMRLCRACGQIVWNVDVSPGT